MAGQKQAVYHGGHFHQMAWTGVDGQVEKANEILNGLEEQAAIQLGFGELHTPALAIGV